MDVKSFIESGILETWVLGACTTDESALVQQMMQYPEVQAEVKRIESDLEVITQKFAIQPPDHLKTRVQQAVRDAAKDSGHLPTSDHTLNGRPWLNTFLIAVATAGLLASLWFYLQKGKTDMILSATQQELSACQTREEAQTRMQEQIAMMNDTATIRYQLASLTPQFAIHATLYSSQTQGRCLISVAAMGKAPTGKSFQLWAIQAGKPVSLGVMETIQNPTELREITCATGAEAYAVSLEPEGGSSTPTEVIMMNKG